MKHLMDICFFNAGWLQETAPGTHTVSLPFPTPQTKHRSYGKTKNHQPQLGNGLFIPPIPPHVSHQFTAQLQITWFIFKAFVFSHIGLQLSYTCIYIYLFIFVNIQTTQHRTEPTTTHGSHATMRIEKNKTNAVASLSCLPGGHYTMTRSMPSCKEIRGTWLYWYFFFFGYRTFGNKPST